MKEKYPKVYLYKRIVQAKLFIDEHFAEPIDLDNIADEACFSRFHFLRLFRNIYGRSPHQYLAMVRIEKAKQYLQKNTPVAEACYLVGYESVSSFTGLFKKQTGSSPSLYQRRWRLRQETIKRSPLRFIPNCFAQQKGWTQKSNFEEV